MSDRRAERQAKESARRREVLALPVVATDHYVRLEAPGGMDHLVTSALGPDGEIYALWSTADGSDELLGRTISPGGASFAHSLTTRPVSAVVTAHGRNHRAVVALADLDLAYPVVQPLPGGQVLIVGARARWRSEGPDKNAVVVDADGNRIREATLGDGIKQLQTTTSGVIWVGYSDVGIFGDNGWGAPDGPTPIGHSGIARFDSDLTMQWGFDGHVHDPLGYVADCYALNVVGEIAWSCYYYDFPVVRIDGGEVTGWTNPVQGARALAVADDDRILLVGGYGADRDRLVEGRLIDGQLDVLSESRLTLPDGVELPREASLIGCGPDLFAITERDCYRVSIR